MDKITPTHLRFLKNIKYIVTVKNSQFPSSRHLEDIPEVTDNPDGGQDV